MIVIRSNGSTWQGEEEKPIEHLFETLANYALDPRFEEVGGFIHTCHIGVANWESGRCVIEDGPPMYPDSPNALHFFGNFWEKSSVFSIDTDEPDLIAKLTAAIQANVATPAYAKARRELGMHDKPIRWSEVHQSSAPSAEAKCSLR